MYCLMAMCGLSTVSTMWLLWLSIRNQNKLENQSVPSPPSDSRITDALLQVIKARARNSPLKDLLRIVLDATYKMLRASRVTVYLVDQTRKEAWVCVSRDSLEGLRVAFGQGIAGSVAQTGHLLNVQDAYSDPRFNRSVDKNTGFVTRSVLCAPVFCDISDASFNPSKNSNGKFGASGERREVAAVIQAMNKQDAPHFTHQDEEALEAFCAEVAMALRSRIMEAHVLRMARDNELDAPKRRGSLPVEVSLIQAFGGGVDAMINAQLHLKRCDSQPKCCELSTDEWPVPDVLQAQLSHNRQQLAPLSPTRTTHQRRKYKFKTQMDGSGRLSGSADHGSLRVDTNEREGPIPHQFSQAQSPAQQNANCCNGLEEDSDLDGEEEATSIDDQSSAESMSTHIRQIHSLTELGEVLNLNEGGGIQTSSLNVASPKLDSKSFNRTFASSQSAPFMCETSPQQREDMADTRLSQIALGSKSRHSKSQILPTETSVPAPMPPKQLAHVYAHWNFDVLACEEGLLLACAEDMFYQLGLTDAFAAFDSSGLRRLLLSICEGYSSANPFHNFHHAFSTAHASFLIMLQLAQANVETECSGSAHSPSSSITSCPASPQPSTSPQSNTPTSFHTPRASSSGNDTAVSSESTVVCRLSPLDMLATLLSSLCHDLGHPGHTNSFEIAASTARAELYCDDSVLERYHARQACLLLRREECQLSPIFKQGTDTERSLRTLLIAAVLGTDMSNHFEGVDRLRARAAQDHPPGFFGSRPDDRKELLVSIVHTADLVGQALPHHLARVWGERVVQEFISQSKTEQRLQMPLTSYMQGLEGNAVRQAKLQAGFVQQIVIPLWSSMAHFIPGLQRNVDYARDNVRAYEAQIVLAAQASNAVE